MQVTPLILARQQIQFAREYTRQLLSDVADHEWFCCPQGTPSHLAWQMGHLAMAEYGLALLRIRGKLPGDADWISNDFIRCFKKGSHPEADATQYPSINEIRRVWARVHEQAMQEMEGYRIEDLSQPLAAPYAVYATKLGSLLFCSAHEMLHAGQIGLLRRLLGKSPVR